MELYVGATSDANDIKDDELTSVTIPVGERAYFCAECTVTENPDSDNIIWEFDLDGDGYYDEGGATTDANYVEFSAAFSEVGDCNVVVCAHLDNDYDSPGAISNTCIVTAVGVKEVVGDPNNSGPLYVCLGGSVDLEAIPDPSTVAFPAGEPTWEITTRPAGDPEPGSLSSSSGRTITVNDLTIAGDYTVEAMCGTSSDSITITVVGLALKASNVVPGETAATTEGAGTSSDPTTLLIGMEVVPPLSWGIWEENHETVAQIELSAYSDTAMTTQSFPPDNDIPEWTVSGPSGGNFEGNALEDPREATGTNVSFYATTPGLYTFTAEVSGVCPLSKGINVYVARTHINEYPEYMFANAAQARIPLGFEIQGIGTNNFYLDTSSSSTFEWRARYWSLASEVYFDMSMDNDLDKNRFAPAWTDTSSRNGESNSYKAVTNAHPLDGAEMTDTSGVTDNVALSMICDGKVLLDGEEETNYALIVATKLDDVKDVKFVDKRWPTIEIGENQTFDASFGYCRGKGYFEHIYSNNETFDCSGYSNLLATFGDAGDFTAGSDKKYKETDEVHYHRPALGPRGFSEAGADVALAAMTSDLSADGLTVESRLYDDFDIASDDEEEYVAKALGAAITTNVFISYKLKKTTFFGDYYDTSVDHGHLSPKILPDAKWTYALEASGAVGGGDWLGVALTGAGVAVTVLTIIACPPAGSAAVVWWGWGLLTAGSLVTTAGGVATVSSFTAYDDQVASATILWTDPYYSWDSTTMGTITGSHGATGTGATGGPSYTSNGRWADFWTNGVAVDVGSQYRTSFEIHTTAQNKSNATDPIDDVSARVTLERTRGSHDLRDVEYEWR